MSKSRIGIAVAVLATLLSSEAFARAHLGMGPLGVARLALGGVLAVGGLHRGRSRHDHIRTATLRSRDVRSQDVRSQDAGKAAESARPPGDPATRTQIAAAAALAGWHGGRSANGWWRHGDGGYGWVGPVFWPFAYDDIYDYALWGDGIGLWDYGYPDISAGIFAPYGQTDLAAYAGPRPSGRSHRRVPPAQELCGAGGSETSGLPVDQVLQAIQPNEAQHAALDDLAKAWISAARMIRASCSTQAAFTAPQRLAIMQQRLAAMIKAELDLQPPLEKFFELLDDAQKAKFNALGDDRRKAGAANRPVDTQGCDAAQAATLPWPADQIEAALHPNDTQRTALEGLRKASARAVDILNNACRPKDALTPLARLDAVDDRLDAMQQAVNLVSDALEEFYATLSDEQKAQFEAIGPKRTS